MMVVVVYCGKLFVDFGVDVVKVEIFIGDFLCYMMFDLECLLFFFYCNILKCSVVFDFDVVVDEVMFMKLFVVSDVLIVDEVILFMVVEGKDLVVVSIIFYGFSGLCVGMFGGDFIFGYGGGFFNFLLVCSEMVDCVLVKFGGYQVGYQGGFYVGYVLGVFLFEW